MSAFFLSSAWNESRLYPTMQLIPEKSVLLTLIKVRHKAADSITEQRGQQKKNEKVGMVNSVTVPAYRRKWGLKADLGSDLAYASH